MEFIQGKVDLGEISIDLSTSKLSKKLRAIAKHTSALADELEKIDQSTCPECGNALTEDTIHADGEVLDKNVYCTSCNYIENNII
ncbi:hypothetical protein [Metabacillus sp. 22489]|uniref:hypothetical protein n=1 Tax=Metabacillus sp. 22489 TaxID=3453928 RepID=UPI003F84C16D